MNYIVILKEEISEDIKKFKNLILYGLCICIKRRENNYN